MQIIVDKIKLLSIFVLTVLFVLSCTSSPKNVLPTVDLIKCASPKPQVCTREYRPVCGFENDGNHHTYSNACTACSNSNVISYNNGDCSNLQILSK